MTQAPLVSIVLVNYKTPDLLLRCVRSVYKYCNAELIEIIVVDNFSEDESLTLLEREFPQVQTLQMDYNSGFARGNNRGLRLAKGKYALLLNSDAFFNSDAVGGLIDYYIKLETNDNPGLLGCHIVNEHGELLRGTHIGFPGIKKLVNANPIVIYLKKRLGVDINAETQRSMNEQEKLHYQNHEADIVSGACVFFNLQVLKADNLFLDEDFFLYSEDVEWSNRYKKKGYKNHFTTHATIVHKDSGSSVVATNKRMQITISEWLLMLKIRGVIYYVAYMLFFRLNLWLDTLLANRYRETVADVATGEREEIARVWNKYFLYIVKTYWLQKASNRPFLRYEPVA